MKMELYLGLDVDKEWIVITVAEWGRNGAVQDQSNLTRRPAVGSSDWLDRAFENGLIVSEALQAKAQAR